MRALVTGAGGFVGANLVRHLLAHGHEPIAAIRPRGNRARMREVERDVRIEPIDLRDPTAVITAVRSIAPEVVFHLAAYGAYSWQTELDAMLAVNVRATEAILEGARAIDARVIHAGSSSEYGFRSAASQESDRLEPNSHYAVTKAAATHLCSLASAQHGQYAVTLRLYSIYGPWEEPGRLMPTLVSRALTGEYPPLVAPETARDFVWVYDACEAFVAAAAAARALSPAVLNIASGRQTTLGGVVETAREVFGITDEPTWGQMANRAWDTSIWLGDTRKAERALAWRAHTTLSEGMRQMANWMNENPDVFERYAGWDSSQVPNPFSSRPLTGSERNIQPRP